jgi:hypothetical protein
MLGHIDRKGLRDDVASRSWNSSHPSRGPCSPFKGTLLDLRLTLRGSLARGMSHADATAPDFPLSSA